MIKDISNTNKDKTKLYVTNPKITFYVNLELWKKLDEERKEKGYSSIGSYCKVLAIQRHDHKNRNTDDF